MAKPKFSVSQITTFHQTFDEDLASYAAAGVEGVGIWEFKLPEDGDDARGAREAEGQRAQGHDHDPGHALDLSRAVPGTRRSGRAHGGVVRDDPALRAVRARGGARPPGRARRGQRSGRGAARDRRGIPQGRQGRRRVRPHARAWSRSTARSTAPGRPSTRSRETIDLIDEIGEPNVQVLYDVYHLHDTDNVLEDTVKYGSRISPSIHICDWREVTRNDFDRVLPGDGIIDLAGDLRRARRRRAIPAGSTSRSSRTTARSARWTSRTRSGSRTAADVLARAKAGFDKAWAARRPPA